ncbi:lipoprotein-releasing system transmembrane subunit LolC [Coxiella-like endosymbiont of Rhipicephalus sanguineus]|uniref:lipoprotein-releasing ABC transporter permease subunit n=1 Tax=Coxiella-like endosymbiont of Rhipicephalus sanguineus TaxID=1955402 RepID=UPI00203C10E7|nr:lipoprotein-releasing ABC transporter permease subunit [Coxiella-like endosymbiont of Rhipicephalus sanguineus]MBT8506469.1 lipoprotein-releasing system transmembrane subunit LolC [Coxiella-like endosymbiont of Rhipicephalus sanguineus]
MIRPLALYVGLRYTRAKRRNHFISFISLASMLGIALGVAVLIVVLSVMNGFDYQIRTQFFAIAPEVTILSGQDISKTWPTLQKTINANTNIIASAPFVTGMGMLSNKGVVSGVNVLGILSSQEMEVSKLDQKMVQGHLNTLVAGNYNIILGQKLANQLGLSLGNKVNLFTPQATTTLLGVFPQFRRFTVSGIFSAKGGFDFDTGIAYINMIDGMKLFPQGRSGLHVKIRNIYQAEVVSRELQNALTNGFMVTNWTEQFGSFFNAIAMEKTIMFVILLLIVAVAVFNLVSTLVMVVNDKRADIAILRTLGASPHTIMSIFVIQGAIVGLIGTLIGIIGGVILAWNTTAIVNFVQNLFHVQFLKSSLFFVNFLPSRLQWLDVLNISVIALVLSLIATIYPALIAFRTEPAEALRYE